MTTCSNTIRTAGPTVGHGAEPAVLTPGTHDPRPGPAGPVGG
ncbi:hypothetical protein [Nocardioides plantarum]